MIPIIFFAIVTGIIILVLIGIVFDIDRKEKESKKRREMYIEHIDALTRQCELEMESMQEYNEVLDNIGRLLSAEKYDELRKYSCEVVEPLCTNYEKDDTVLNGLSHIKNKTIRGIIYNQILKIKHAGMNLSADMSDIAEIPIRMIDYSGTLNVFIDNAIEAAEKTEEKYVFVGIFQSDEGIVTRVENTCKAAPEISRIYDFGYSEKGTGRGIGLFGVKKKLDKYVNAGRRTFYDEENNLFVQELKLASLAE